MSKITVIIPAYNEESTIVPCLQSLVSQTHREYQVFVIDDQSKDKTRDLILEFVQKDPERFKLYEFGKVGPARARNLCAPEAPGEILAFMDADCIATPEWLEQIDRCFTQHPEIASAGGPHLLRPNATDFEKKVDRYFRQVSPLIDFYKMENAPEGYTNHNPLCNVAYRKNIFLQLRGFREDLFPGEDIELDLRVRQAGHKIYFSPHARVYHRRPLSEAEFAHMMFKYGRAQGQMLRSRGPERLGQCLAVALILIWILSLAGAAAGSALSIGFAISLPTLILIPSPRGLGLLSLYALTRRWFAGLIRGLLIKFEPWSHHETM